MTHLIAILLQISILGLVFAIGLRARARDVAYVLRRPRLLLCSLLTMNVVMPLFALALAVACDLRPAVKVALLSLSVAPIPPLVTRKVMQAGAGGSFAIGLLITTAVLAMAFVPLSVHLLGMVFGLDTQIGPQVVAGILARNIFAPIVTGALLGRYFPAIAARVAPVLSRVASLLLCACMIPLLIRMVPPMLALLGQGTLLAMLAFALVGLLAGHLLGGPDAQDRATLALTTASRHPGVAGAIAALNFPGAPEPFAAIAMYLLISVAVTLPYAIWFRRSYQADTDNLI